MDPLELQVDALNDPRAQRILQRASVFMQERNSGLPGSDGVFIPTRPSEYHAWHQAMFGTYVPDTFGYRTSGSIVGELQREWITATTIPRYQPTRFGSLRTGAEFIEENATSKYFYAECASERSGTPVELNSERSLCVPSDFLFQADEDIGVEEVPETFAQTETRIPDSWKSNAREDALELELLGSYLKKQKPSILDNELVKVKVCKDHQIGRVKSRSSREKLKALEWQGLVHYNDDGVIEMGEVPEEPHEKAITMPHSYNVFTISDPPLMRQPDGMLTSLLPAVRTCMPISPGVIAEPTALMAIKENEPHGLKRKHGQDAEEDEEGYCSFALEIDFDEDPAQCIPFPETLFPSAKPAENVSFLADFTEFGNSR